MFQIFRLSGCKRAISGRKVQKRMMCFTMLLHCYLGKALYFPLVSCRLVWYSKEKGKPQKRPTLNYKSLIYIKPSLLRVMAAIFFCP